MRVIIGPYVDDGEREVSVEIEKHDTWNMDHTLALIILPMLKQLKKTKHGSPAVADSDVPIGIRSLDAPAKENDWDTDDNWFKRWDWVLNEMIWTFEQLVDDHAERQFYSGDTHLLWQPYDKNEEALDIPLESEDKTWDDNENVHHWRMVNGPNDTFKVDTEAREKWQQRINNGLRLFGVYFQGLWD